MFHIKTDLPNEEPPAPLTEQQNINIQHLAETYDQSKKGSLEFDEFIGFIKAATGLNNFDYIEENVPESGKINIVFLKFLYDGIDLNQSDNLSIKEVCDCFFAINQMDYKWIAKMVFRGCDFERKKKICAEYIQNAIQNVDKDAGNSAFSTKKFNEKCKSILGETKKNLEYWEFVKLVTGETIDPSTDPYDGELENKSKCCLLI